MRLTDELEQFLVDCGYKFVTRSVDVLEWRQGDFRDVLRRTSKGLTLATVERDFEYPANITTTSPDILYRYIVLMVGSAWRSENRLPDLPTVESIDGILDVEAIETETDAEVRWTCADGAMEDAHGMILPDARSLALYLQYPLSDVIATYRSPKGHPIFD